MHRRAKPLTILSIVVLLFLAVQAQSSAHASSPPLSSFCWYPIPSGNQIGVLASASDNAVNQVEFVFRGQHHQGRRQQQSFSTSYSVHARAVAQAEQRGHLSKVTVKVGLASGTEVVYRDNPIACG